MASTPGAVIRYTLDGSPPTAEHGEIYSHPIHIDKTTSFCAVAILPDRAASPVSITTYLLPGSSKAGLSSVGIGNSLTGTTMNFWRFARTAGTTTSTRPRRFCAVAP